MAEHQHKAELTSELARSRELITTNWQVVRRDLNFVARARRSFARHPAVWIAAAGLLGLFVAGGPFRRKRTSAKPRKKEATVEKVEKAGLLLAGLKFAFSIARPALTTWVTRRAADYFAAGERGRSERY